MNTVPTNLALLAVLFISCSNTTAPAEAQAQQKISQFDRAVSSDFLVDKNGVYHVVFQESPAVGKPLFIYYSTSTDKGASWSKPVTVSNDNTGNAATHPRIIQDGSGKIYAIWKRLGNTIDNSIVGDPLVDGPGGYTIGTLFYKVLSNGAWSDQVQLGEMEGSQETWFATVSATGLVFVFWAQASPLSVKNHVVTWYYCDYLRTTSLSGTAHTPIVDLSTPNSPANQYLPFPSKQAGAINLDGYIDKAGTPHLIYEDGDSPGGVRAIKYYNGQAPRVLYSYPLYKEGLSFENPPRLLVDEKGIDHLVFKPSPATLESEQIWDIDLSTNKASVLTAIQQPGVSITGFQASQGPNGQMAVIVEAGTVSGNKDAYGMFYKNGSWTNIGLTNNAAKNKFFSKEFVGLGGLTSVSVLTTYNSTYASVAYDAAGHKSLIMTIAGHTVSNGGYGIDNPFITFMPVDR